METELYNGGLCFNNNYYFFTILILLFFSSPEGCYILYACSQCLQNALFYSWPFFSHFLLIHPLPYTAPFPSLSSCPFVILCTVSGSVCVCLMIGPSNFLSPCLLSQTVFPLILSVMVPPPPPPPPPSHVYGTASFTIPIKTSSSPYL